MNKEEYLKKKALRQRDFEEVQRRDVCFTCRRTKGACLCESITTIETKTKFVLLMHPMEAKKEKVGTGRLTHASLPNSEIIVSVSFIDDPRVNQLIGDPTKNCFVMYPGKTALNISETKFTLDNKNADKELVVFVIDATWPCAKKMMKLSENLLNLPRLCFTPSERSKFHIKHQPMEFCLSTIESVHYFLGALKEQGIEDKDLSEDGLLKTLEALVNFQLACEEDPDKQTYRRNSFTPAEDRVKSLKWGTRSLFVD
ncbi:hypothetical protein A9Q84_03820 [Halobacteriovorax marinus]|uniref:tRNA-uridine aminocarboxypropyltransferase n=1 Tax=Halobacteriovorax marinus TaxID=97084 RepID=A0A1Y5FA36_9BACT|nr:hypothetical protein A9Q84_03820 [Halobacteriovorax marinus]